MKKINLKIIKNGLASIGLFLLPFLANAQSSSSGILAPLVVCGYDNHSCQFQDLIVFVNNFIHDLIILAIPFATIAFAWAGFLILTSAGDTSKMKRGRGVLIKVAIGFIIILAAYTVVSFITKTFVKLPSQFNLLQQ